VLRADTLAGPDLARYLTIILPDCAFLTPAQAALLTDALSAGKRLLVLGELGTNLPSEMVRPILEHPGTLQMDPGRSFSIDELPIGPQVRVTPPCDVMVNLQRVAGEVAVHLIRYDFDTEQDQTPPLAKLTIEIELPQRFGKISLHAPGGTMMGTLEVERSRHRLALRDVPLYGIAHLTAE
jgi:hypothetical protein